MSQIMAKYLPEYKTCYGTPNASILTESIWVNKLLQKRNMLLLQITFDFTALYNYGGIYLDSDVEVLKSFNDLLTYPILWGQKGWHHRSGHIRSRKGTEWIKICLDYYTDKTFIKQDSSLDIRKLPEIMVEELEKFKPIHYLDVEEMKNIKNMDFQKEILVMPNEYFHLKFLIQGKS